MSGLHSQSDVILFLDGIAGELAEIHRAKHYSQWRSEAAHRVSQYLAEAEPFAKVANSWVFSGDGAGSIVGYRFGDWAIDQLLEKLPADIVARFDDEVARNAAVYEDVSPVLGIEIKEPCDLARGISVVPASTDIFGGTDYPWRHRGLEPSQPCGGRCHRRCSRSSASSAARLFQSRYMRNSK